MWQIIVTILVGSAATGHSQLQQPMESNYHVVFTEVALDLIRRFIAPKTNTLMVMERCSHCDLDTRNYQNNVLDYLVRNFNANMAIQLFFEHSENKPWDYNLFIVDSHMAFIELRIHFPDTMHERQFFFFILYTNLIYYDSTRENVMVSIFRTCRQFNVINAVIMMPRYDGTIGFYTYCIYTPSVCDQYPRVVEINAYRNGRLDFDMLFPERLTNFYNCSLKVCARLLYPMLSYRRDETGAPQSHQGLSGIDGDLLNMLAEALRFRIDVTVPEVISQIGVSKNSTGCFKQLQNYEADIVIGGYSNTQPHFQMFTSTTPYHQSMYYFLVRSGVHFGALEQLANPFQRDVWWAIAGILLVAMASIKLMLTFAPATERDFIFGRRNYSPITQLITSLMGNPISRLPRRNFARFLLMSWLMITLVLRNAYQGKMFDSLRTSKRVPVPRGINELIDRRYILFAARYVDFYPENLTYVMKNLGLRFQIIENSTDPLATLSLLDTLAAYNRYRINGSQLTFVNEAIYTFQLVMFFPKHSILKASFDRKLKQLISAGITQYVADRHVNRRYLNLNVGNRKVPQISNSTLFGVYIIYGGMCAVALLVFLLELYSKKSRRVRKALNWIHYSAYYRANMMADED